MGVPRILGRQPYQVADSWWRRDNEEAQAHGHRTFTCATIREVEDMDAAGLGDDLLLANEVYVELRPAAGCLEIKNLPTNSA